MDWLGAVIIFCVVPGFVAGIIGEGKGKRGAGIALGLFLSWLGVIIIACLPLSDDAMRAREYEKMTLAERRRFNQQQRDAENAPELERERREQEMAVKREQESIDREKYVALEEAYLEAAVREQENGERIAASKLEQEHKEMMEAKRDQEYKEMLAAVSGGREVIKVRCSKCGALVNEGVKFCSYCGTPMAAVSVGREVVKVRCSKCGALMNEGVKFCAYCGKPM
ncbi:MAG: zinc-ribbon domain-containing protein [bacterium]|nr:zinc-ribbon domain-containing protein [bacterium]